MKKLILSALIISTTAFAEGNDTTITYKKTAEIAYIESVNTIEDMREWMKSDIDNLLIDQEIGQAYLDNLNNLLSKLEDINAGLLTNK